jgi:hypothetical protein
MVNAIISHRNKLALRRALVKAGFDNGRFVPPDSPELWEKGELRYAVARVEVEGAVTWHVVPYPEGE